MIELGEVNNKERIWRNDISTFLWLQSSHIREAKLEDINEILKIPISNLANKIA